MYSYRNTTRTHLSKGKFICITKLQLSRLKVYILSHSHNQLKFVYHFSITCLYKMHKISFMKILYRRKKVHISMVSFLGILCLIRIGKKIQFFIETMNFYSLQKMGKKAFIETAMLKYLCIKYSFVRSIYSKIIRVHRLVFKNADKQTIKKYTIKYRWNMCMLFVLTPIIMNGTI